MKLDNNYFLVYIICGGAMRIWDLIRNYLGSSADLDAKQPIDEPKGPAGLVDIVYQKNRTGADLQAVAAAHEKSLAMWNTAGFAKKKEIVVRQSNGVPVGWIAAVVAVEMMEHRR